MIFSLLTPIALMAGLGPNFLRLGTVAGYDLVKDYSGTAFFDDWTFYGNYDNLTSGDVWWVDESDAFSQGLVYVNSADNAIIKVDDTNYVAFNDKRNSVRITSNDAYAVGSLWIIDLVHLPFGCSVWPAFWTMGPTWPNDGEIDIIEGINVQANNQMALHTTSGCVHTTPPNQMGVTGVTDCSNAAGCTVTEVNPNSYGSGFAAAGGGVWATQFDVAGIFIWFWSRPNIPASITQSTSTSSIDVSTWGPPSASYMATTCNITEFFTPQNLVLDITLCGIWAGLETFYGPSCGSVGSTGICYNDNVVGNGANYDDAYFEVSYIRAYTTGGIAPTPTAAAVAVATASTTPVSGTALADNGNLRPSPLFFGGASPSSSLGWLSLAAVLPSIVVGMLLIAAF